MPTIEVTKVFNPKERLEPIQALRFVAAFAVIIHHSLTAFGPRVTSIDLGAAGVDVFFVISGVVIGYADHSDGPLRFAIKRLIRVLPLYWLATLVYGIFRYFVWNDYPSTERILRSVFLIPDFTQSWVPIYYPAWTLCFELGFYTLFGLILCVTRRHTVIGAAIVAMTAAVIPIPVPFVPGATADAFLFLEFSAGLLIAAAWQQGFRLPRPLAYLALSASLLGFMCRPSWSGSLRVLEWGVPASLLVFGALSLDRAAIFRWRALSFGGDASYALYLFQIPLMEGMYRSLVAEGVDLNSRIRFIALRETLLVGSALIGGFAIHRFLERPMLRALRRALLPRMAPPRNAVSAEENV